MGRKLSRYDAGRSHYVGDMRARSNVFAESMSLKTDSNEWFEMPHAAPHHEFFRRYVIPTECEHEDESNDPSDEPTRGVLDRRCACVSLDGVANKASDTYFSSGVEAGFKDEDDQPACVMLLARSRLTGAFSFFY